MSLTVVKCNQEGSKCVVILKSNNFESVTNTEAKQRAIKEASKVLGTCGISSTSGPYPVGEDDNELDMNKMAEYTIDNCKTIRYCNDFHVMQSF